MIMGDIRSYADYIEAINKGERDEDIILKLFFLNGIDDSFTEGYSDGELSVAGRRLMEILFDTNALHIIDILDEESDSIKEIVTGGVPQFSEFDDVDKVLKILQANEGCEFAYIGYMFNKNAREDAQYKYGENHYKLCYQLGLVRWAGKAKKSKKAGLNYLGRIYLEYPEEERECLRAKLCFRLPLIQKELTEAKHGVIDGRQPMIDAGLSPSTVLRRRSSTKQMMRAISRILPKEKDYTKNIDWF